METEMRYLPASFGVPLSVRELLMAGMKTPFMPQSASSGVPFSTSETMLTLLLFKSILFSIVESELSSLTQSFSVGSVPFSTNAP